MKTIKELRAITGLSQSEFAKKYDIPVKTLQNWECGLSHPTTYLLKLIASTLDNKLIKIIGDNKKENTVYYYDENKKIIYDKKGNCLSATINIKEVNEHNLGIYLDFLFEDYYKALESFNQSLEMDKKLDRNTVWERFW